MNRLLIPLFLLLAVACSDRNRVARQSEDVEAQSVVVVHPDIDNRIRYVKHDVGRTADGRLSIVVVLASRSGKDRSLIVTTDWYDEKGVPVERSDPHQILIPSGGTYVYEDSAFSAKAAKFSVAVREASTKRKS